MIKFRQAILLLFVLASPPVWSQTRDHADSVSLLFIGDIMGHDTQIQAALDPKTNAYHYDDVFEKISGTIQRVDFAIANLEVTLAGSPYTGYPQFSSPDELAVACRNAGIDALVTANNHSCDKGSRGILRTIRVLDSLHIPHTGTFTDSLSETKNNLLILEKNHIRIGILNYTYGTNEIPTPYPTRVNRIDTAKIAKDMEAGRKEKVDKLVVFVHWGIEYENNPSANQVAIAEYLFKNGADIIIGSHPHVVQRMEMKDNRFIVYSLGNFVSAQRTRGRDGGCMVRLTISATGDKTWISRAGYYLTWVNVCDSGDGRQKYQILPCSVMTSRNYEGMTPAAIEKMNTFCSDTRRLFGDQNIMVTEIQAE